MQVVEFLAVLPSVEPLAFAVGQPVHAMLVEMREEGVGERLFFLSADHLYLIAYGDDGSDGLDIAVVDRLEDGLGSVLVPHFAIDVL